MNELKCPKCGEVFMVDKSGYSVLLGQVRDAEFHKELEERTKSIAIEKDRERELVMTQEQVTFDQQLANAKEEISKLKTQLVSVDNETQIALKEEELKRTKELSQKTAMISKLEEELKQREQAATVEKETALQIADARAKADLEKTLSDAKQEIERLKTEKETSTQIAKAELEKTLSDARQEIEQLKTEKEMIAQVAEATAKTELEKVCSDARQEIAQLKAQLSSADMAKALALREIVETEGRSTGT